MFAKRIRAQSLVVLALYLVSFIPLPVSAARVQSISYSVIPATASVAANHSVLFQAKSTISSGTIKLYLSRLISSTGSVDYTDIDFSYGATAATANQNELPLAAAPGNGIWGVAVNSGEKTLTLTYPSSGAASIPVNNFVSIVIGTHAYSGSSGTHQLINSATNGSKSISLTVGADSHLLSVGLSASATATASATTPDLVAVPTAPSSLVLASGSNGVSTQTNEIDIAWTDNSSNESYFSIERKPENGAFSQISTTTASVYANSSLTASTTYVYRVSAVNGAGASTYSNELTVTTATPPGAVAPPPAPVPAPSPAPQQNQQSNPSGDPALSQPVEKKGVPPPVAPSLFLVRYDVSKKQVEISWTGDISNAVKIELQRSASLGNFATIQNVSLEANTVAALDMATQLRASYGYRLKISGADNSFVYSTEAAVTTQAPPAPPPAAPTDLSVSAQDGVASLAWTDNATNETGFELLRRPAFSGKVVLPQDASNYSDRDVISGKQYIYRLRAINKSGVSDFTSETSILIPRIVQKPGAPILSASYDPQSRVVALVWTYSGENQISFQLMRKATGAAKYALAKEIDSEKSFDKTRNTYSASDSVEYGSSYQYVIRVSNETDFVDSNEVSITSSTPPPAKPEIPQTISASIDGEKVRVQWEYVSTSETRIEIQRSPAFPINLSRENGSIYLAKGVKTYIDYAVDYTTRYQYRVRAVNASVVSAQDNWSGAAEVATPAAPLPPPPPPPAPPSLDATPQTDQLVLNWSPSDEAKEYRIERRLQGEQDYDVLVNTSSDTHSYIDATANPGDTYEYRITPVNDGGDGASALVADATVIASPFKKSETQVVYTPPLAEEKVVLADGGVVKTENKAGAGLELTIPKDVNPIVEGDTDRFEKAPVKTDTTKALESVAEELNSIQSIPVHVQEKAVESIAKLIHTALEQTPLALLSEKERRYVLGAALAIVDDSVAEGVVEVKKISPEISTVLQTVENDFNNASDTSTRAVDSLDALVDVAQKTTNTFASLSTLTALSESVEKLINQPIAQNKSDIQSVSADIQVEVQTIIDALPDTKSFSQATQEKIVKADSALQKDLGDLARDADNVGKGVVPIAQLIKSAQSVQKSVSQVVTAHGESSEHNDAASIVTHALDINRESNSAKNALDSILEPQAVGASKEEFIKKVEQEKRAIQSVLDSSASILARDTVQLDNSQESEALVSARSELIIAQKKVAEVLGMQKRDTQEDEQVIGRVRSSIKAVGERVTDLVQALTKKQDTLTPEAVKEVHIQALEIKRSTNTLVESTDALLDAGSRVSIDKEKQDDLTAAVNRIQQAEDVIQAKTQKFIEILSDVSTVVSVSRLKKIATDVADAKTTLEDARENYKQIIGQDVQSQSPSTSSLNASVGGMTTEQVTTRLESIVSAVANVVPSLRKYVVSSSVKKDGAIGTVNQGAQASSAGSSLEIASEKAPLHISINPLSPTRSLVEHTLGSAALLDSQPAEFKQAGGVGPAYMITADVANPASAQQSLGPIQTPHTSFVQKVKAFIVSIGRMLFMPAFAQTSTVSNQSTSASSAYPSYQAELPVTKFDPSLSYVFKYTPEDVVNVDETTIKLYSWNEVNEQWKLEESKLDTNAKTVMAEVGHLSIFRLFGESLGIPPSAKKNIITVPSSAIDVITSELSNENLGLANETESQPMTIAKTTFYTTPNTAVSMCIPGKIFKKSVKKILLSIGSSRYTLNYQKARDCYATRVTVPDTKGRQAVVLKVIYIDDQTQIVRLETEITGQFEAKLLTTVVPALQQVQVVAVATNTAVQKTVQKTQPVLQTAAIVTAPVVTVANPVVLSQTINFFSYIGHFISWILSLLGLRKKRKQWGVVYDAITKTPIDLVIIRLFDAQSKKLIETQVTDKQGRFSFLATPGTYTVSATKLPYIFPSAVLRGASDGEYAHLYHGEPVIVKSIDDQISISVPLDPPAAEKIHAHQSPFSFTKNILVHVSRGSLIAGFVVSILLAIYTPSTQNTILLVINWVYASYQVFVMVKKERPWGVVFDALTLKPVPLAAISIFDAKEKKLLRTRLSDYEGRFTFLTPPGEYQLSAYKDQYVFPAAHPSQGGKFSHPYVGGALQVKKKNQTIKVNIPLDQKIPAQSDSSDVIASEARQSSRSTGNAMS
ncbi:MAG: fibronectin type III domain-containing protein [bacterium]|nr:fibronectin type III domain-containing protein [bacterium]